MPNMKTHREIIAEAQRLEEQGRRYADEQRLVRTMTARLNEATPRWLMALPESQFTSRHFGADPVHTHRLQRRVEMMLDSGAPEFLLIQEETETSGSGQLVRQVDPFVTLHSDLAYDVLREGYGMVEEERLGEALGAYMERIEKAELTESIDGTWVDEIEKIVEADKLSVTARMRTKAAIIEFLEGRLESSAFITAAIERQVFRDEERLGFSEHQTVSERQMEQIKIEW